MIQFDNSYARLPAGFFAAQPPTPVRAPQFLAINRPLAERLGLSPDWLSGPEGLDMAAGNRLPDGAAPLAQAYAGHQFANLVPQLGDGRAVLLGEVIAPDGARFDIQLKGAGPTPFSRAGDGRAWLGPVLREYLLSEFMAAMQVPTTRALAAVSTGETVWRDTALPGAILTRVAQSHIRIGTFQFFALRQDEKSLSTLTDYTIARHYPAAGDALGLLSAVVAAQADTIADWMALGFVHGVMNTDNMAISGETIDYGPAAFIDRFDPDAVFSAIDRRGRYRWSQQPDMAVWNLAQLATALLPLIGGDDAALDQATKAVHGFAPLYESALDRRLSAKIGLLPGNAPLAVGFLRILHEAGADFTQSFIDLAQGTPNAALTRSPAFAAWDRQWQARQPDAALMAGTNPRRIPRNHQVESVIAAAVAGDLAPFHRLLSAVTHPFTPCDDWADLDRPPSKDEAVTRTFCGT